MKEKVKEENNEGETTVCDGWDVEKGGDEEEGQKRVKRLQGVDGRE